MDFDEAHRGKEGCLVLLNQLEYDTKSGLVVMGDSVLKEIGEEYVKVLTRRLVIASEQAPQLHRQKTVEVIAKVFMGVISEALEELTKDEILTLELL